MEFKTRYNPDQAVYIIENNRIIQLPILGIKINKDRSKKGTEILYSFCVQKATSLSDNDTIVWRDEEDVYATADDIILIFKDHPAVKASQS